MIRPDRDPLVEAATLSALRESLTFLRHEWGLYHPTLPDEALLPCVDAILTAQEAVR